MCDNIEDKLIDRFGEAEIREIVSLIKSISHPNIEIKVIGDTIVLKDCKLAIKFNTVLQAEKNRPIHLRNELKNYEKQGIRMFSIFEYDWDNTNVKRKIIYHLKEIITQKKEHTGKVSDYYISQISNADTYKFLRQWDVMDYISQRINIGCFYKGELVGVAVYGN